MKKENSRMLSELLGEYVKETHLEDGLLRCRIFDAWDLLLSQMMMPYMKQEVTKELTITRYFKDGVLTCKISSSVIRTQLQFQSDSLCRQLNSLLQGEYVTKIVLY